jgi:hypothetical protein
MNTGKLSLAVMIVGLKTNIRMSMCILIAPFSGSICAALRAMQRAARIDLRTARFRALSVGVNRKEKRQPG